MFSLTQKINMKEKGLRQKLRITEALIFLLPSLIISYLFYKNDVFLDFSQLFVLALTLVLILAGLIIMRQVFDKFSIIATSIKRVENGDGSLIEMQQDTSELHEVATSFNNLMKRFEETTAELKYRVFELFAIRELTEAASKVLDINDLMSVLLEKAMAVSQAQNGSIFMVESKWRFRIVASRGLEWNPEKDSYININESLAQLVVSNKKPLLIQDIETDSRTRNLNDPVYKRSSFLSMPILVREQLIAVLNLSHKDGRPAFDSDDEQVLSIMIGEIGFALENAYLHARIEEHVKNLEGRTVELAIANEQLNKEIIEKEQGLEEIRKLNSAIDQAIDGIAISDLELKLSYVNDAFAIMHGYAREEMIGMKIVDLYSKKRRDEHERIMKQVKTLLSWTGEMEHIRKDGAAFSIYISLTLLKKHNSKHNALLLAVRDTTEQKKAEAKLQYIQKIEYLGTLAGGIAHNFNNLLTGIQGNASLMLLETDQAHQYYDKLKIIEKLVHDGAQLTKQLLGYAREGRYEIKSINLNEVVKETSETFGATKKNITVHREFTKNVLGIKADRPQIEQVLWNLYVNAADVMERGGDLFLKTMSVTEKDMKNKSYTPTPGNYVLLSVTDTGTGMNRKTMEKIFDPFFTTKGLGKGTGLGLASVYGIIKAHGGYVDVESKRGKGTSFSIYLPESKKKVEKPNVSSEQISEGRETILLVDDELMLLDSYVELLEESGYTLFEASSGKKAVELYESNKDEIDLVVLDMVMPGMDGGETYDRLKTINPNVKVLLSTGYGLNGQAEEILARGCNGFIQKPFRIKDLSQKLREILDKN